MSDSLRNSTLSCSVILVIACVFICLIMMIGVVFLSADQSQDSTADTYNVQDDAETPAVLPEIGLDNVPNEDGVDTQEETYSSDANPIPAHIAQQMDLIEEQVLRIRGLQPTGDVQRSLLTREELRQRVLDDFLADYEPEDAAEDVIVLSAFGLIQPEYALYDLYVDLFSEQIAGFYDDETNEMVVVQENDFQTLQRLTYAHEYVHALQDQNFDFDEILGYSDEACEVDSERCAAVQALIEGDASFTEIKWFFDYATIEDQQELFESYDEIENTIFESSPAFLQEDFLFPYTYGLEFVQSLYDRGGWAAIDAAFLNPPVTTEQIIHPLNYPNDLPVEIDNPDLLPVLGEEWESLDSGVMGEWYIYLILAHGIDQDARQDEIIAQSAAKGWGGDIYAVYWNQTHEQTAMLMDILWESDAETEEFTEVFIDYAIARFGEANTHRANHYTWQTQDGFHMLQIHGNHTVWIWAPSSEVADSIWYTVNSE